MYKFHTRVRYSELDEYGTLSVGSLVDLLQDTSTFQSTDLNVGVEYLHQKHMAWMVSFWQIVIERMPQFPEEIDVVTAPYKFTPAMGYRNFSIWKDGTPLVKANSLWVLVDLETGRPVRIPEEEMRPYSPVEEPLEMEYAPRKVAVPENLTAGEPLTVSRHHLDTNLHVNNGQYVKIALEQLPEQLEVSELRIEYRRQAVLGDVMIPYVGEDEERYVVVLNNEEGTPYAVAAFYKKRG